MVCEPLKANSALHELRARLLRLLLIGTAIGSIVYLMAGFSMLVTSRLFPWDGLWLLGASAGCALLLSQQKQHLAASLFLAAFSYPICFASQVYGLGSPVSALFLLGIVACGLLIGGWFVGFWAAMYCGWIALAAAGELNGWWTPPTPIRNLDQIAQVVVFWWAIFAATAWAVWLFARSLERAVQVSRGQTVMLTRTLRALAENQGLEHFLSQALRAITEQLHGRFANLWFYDAKTHLITCRMAYSDGRILVGEALRRDVPAPLPAQQVPIWRDLITTRRPVVVDDISNDRRLKNRALIIANQIKVILYVPLLLGGEVVGWFSINSPEQRRFSEDELELAEALARQVTLAMQLARMAEPIQQLTVAEERNGIAREIHDPLAQGFREMVVRLEATEDLLDRTPEAPVKENLLPIGQEGS